MALAAAHSHRIVIVWHLVRCESVLGVATSAIGENAGSSVPLEHLEKRFAAEPSVSAGDAIWRENVHPNDLVLDLQAAAFLGGAESMGTEFECSYNDYLVLIYNLLYPTDAFYTIF